MCGDFFMISIIIRTAIVYIFVTLGIRLMGKRQIGDMQPNELVITLLISETAAIPLQDTTQPILNGIIAIFVLVILEIILSILAMKSFSIRRLLSGQSVVIIKNGLVDEVAMRKVRMTMLDLIEQLRQNGVFNIEDVAYAILEVNGNLSILQKASRLPATPKDLDLKVSPSTLSLPVICDGKIIYESLLALKQDTKKISKILKKEQKTVNEIFLMTLDRDGKYNIVGKRGNI